MFSLNGVVKRMVVRTYDNANPLRVVFDKTVG